MNPNLRWKAALIFGILLVSVFGLTCFRKSDEGKTELSFPRSRADLRSNLSKRINLGLDLRGGMHLILQVQVDEYLNSITDQLTQSLPRLLREQGVGYQAVTKTDMTHVQVTGIPPDKLTDARNFLRDSYGNSYTIGALPPAQSGFVLEMTPSQQAAYRQEALRDSMDTIRQRVDALGVSEPTIAEHGRGEWEILVQLPGVDNPDEVKSILQTTGMLELKLVEDGPFASEGEALARHGGILPPDSLILPHRDVCAVGPTPNPAWYIVSRSSVVTGHGLRNARAEASLDNPGFYEVSFFLSREAASEFGPFTERNIGRPLAAVLDNKVQSVATIKSRIEDSGRITGQFDLNCANKLALLLRSGALRASVKELEVRTVGPSLGADSIRAGFTAAIVGMLAVSLFMLFYYHLSGINAIVTLVLNLLLLLAALAYFRATLTLPGIAGVALTIGMGVDSNVLVFERIREELRSGKSVVSAMETGFDRAFTTILDTHVTTIVSAIFLFMFGTGPIKGFAVTLVIGLLANLFTSVFISRAIFEYVLGRQARPSALSI